MTHTHVPACHLRALTLTADLLLLCNARLVSLHHAAALERWLVAPAYSRQTESAVVHEASLHRKANAAAAEARLLLRRAWTCRVGAEA